MKSFINPYMLGINPKFPTCEKKKKNRENTCQIKQSYAQDNIYMVQQFAYVHRVAEISLLSGKNTSETAQCFILSQDDNNNKILITKNGFYILRPSLHSMH